MEEFKYDNYVPIWDSLPFTIEWQIHNRNETNFDLFHDNVLSAREGINIGILLCISSMVEGYLEDNARQIFIRKIYNDKIDNDTIERITKKFFKGLNKITFNKYNEYFETLIGENLNEIIDEPELWKDIKYLFFIRNIIAHGQGLDMEIKRKVKSDGKTISTNVDYKGNLKEILRFLQGRNYQGEKLSPSEIPLERTFKQIFFRDSVVNYFYVKAKEFLYKLETKLSASNTTHIALGINPTSNLDAIFNHQFE